MKIGFDLDGVLYDWQRAAYNWCVYFNKELKSFEEFFDKLNTDEYSEIFRYNLIRIPLLYRVYPIRKDLKEMLNRLSEKNTLYYITNRPEEVTWSTEKWLEENDIPQRNNLVISQDKTVDIRRLNLNFYFEDRYDVAKKLRLITDVVLVEQPWNKKFKNEFKHFIKDIIHAEELINA